MFYCYLCGEENGWPQTAFKSLGTCEMCGKRELCNDTPSRNLPVRRHQNTRENRLVASDLLESEGFTEPAEFLRRSVGAVQPEWNRLADKLPPDGETVATKIDDANGERNVSKLKRQGRLWFVPDGSMYVYYEPTHWRPL